MATEVLIQTDDVMDFSAVNAFRQDGHFCDTEIRTSDGERLAAHACVVAAGSPVLRHLLLKQSRLRRVLVVQGKDIRVCGAIWRIVLQVMYTGRAFVEIARLAELLLAAETLQIAQLRSLCVMLLDDINPDVDDPGELPELLDVANCNGGFDDSNTKCWTSLADGDPCREYADETVFGELNGVKAVKLEPQTEGYDDALAPMSNEIKMEHEDQHDHKPVFDGHRFVFPTAVNGHVARRKGRHPQRRTSVETVLQNTMAPVRKQLNHRGAGDVPDMNGESSKRFPCDVCGRVFRYASNMNRHRRRDPVCRRPSVTPASALPPRKNRKGQFKCGVCAFVFTSRSSLRRHKRTHAVVTDAPGESNGIYTEIVKQELPTTTPDQNTGVADVDIKPWLYPVVKSETNAADNSLASLLFQPITKPDAPRCVILVSDDDESKTYECTICGKSFNCSKNIRRHERTHLPREIRFAKRIQNAALAALNRKHREYYCSICGKSFPNGKNISRHKKTHHKVEVLPDPESTPVDTSIDYTCPTCGKAFPSRRNLRCHQARAHNAHARVKQEKLSPHDGASPSDSKSPLDGASPSDSKPPLDVSSVADQSNTTLASDQSCDTPPVATVKQERTYSCSVCGRVFASGKNIRRHERSHRQEKRYRCETCGKHFAQSTTLVYHERIHTGEKPHMCRVCGNTYRFPTVLARHERTHNVDLQPAYECSLCGRGFSRRSGLDRHHCSVHDVKVEDMDEEDFPGVDDTAADVMTAGFTTAEVTNEEGFPFGTTAGVTTADVIMADVTNTTADVTNTTDSVITADFTTAGVTTADVISADFTTAGITTADVTMAEVTTAGVMTADVITADFTTADVMTKELTTADVITADITMAGITTADAVTAEVTAAGFITDGDL